VVSYLQDEGYDLSRCNFTGASAGALTATLACTGVDFYEATDLALQMAAKAGVWNRALGLQGIWGPLIEEWLDNLLPESVSCVNGRLSLLVTPIPSLGKKKVSYFNDRNDLLQCNMASVHLPLFLDGKLTSSFRDNPHIDGSFLSRPGDFYDAATENAIWLDWKNDPMLAQKGGLDIVSTLSTAGIWNLIELGRRYAEMEDMKGKFNALKEDFKRDATNNA